MVINFVEIIYLRWKRSSKGVENIYFPNISIRIFVKIIFHDQSSTTYFVWNIENIARSFFEVEI